MQWLINNACTLWLRSHHLVALRLHNACAAACRARVTSRPAIKLLHQKIFSILGITAIGSYIYLAR